MTNNIRIQTDKAPGAIAPYSQGIIAGNTLYISGQIPLDPKTGNVVGDAIEEQTEQVITNIEEVLKAAGLGLKDVVSTTVYLSSFERDFERMNEVYKRRFSHEYKPARAAIGVSVLPKGVLVEIQCIATMACS